MKKKKKKKHNTTKKTNKNHNNNTNTRNSVKIYGNWGWPGVCALIAVSATIALARHAVKIYR